MGAVISFLSRKPTIRLSPSFVPANTCARRTDPGSALAAAVSSIPPPVLCFETRLERLEVLFAGYSVITLSRAFLNISVLM